MLTGADQHKNTPHVCCKVQLCPNVFLGRGEELVLAFKSQLNTQRGKKTQDPSVGLLTLAGKQHQAQTCRFSLLSKVGQAFSVSLQMLSRDIGRQGRSTGCFGPAVTPLSSWSPPHRSTRCTPRWCFWSLAFSAFIKPKPNCFFALDGSPLGSTSRPLLFTVQKKSRFSPCDFF